MLVRTPLRAAAVVTLAALFVGTASASFGATEEVTDPAAQLPGGQFIVLLDEPAAVAYEGGTTGFEATAPAPGQKFNPHGKSVGKYQAHLKKEQAELAGSVGVKPYASYSVAVNGFAAKLTGAQRAELQNTPGVLSVTPDEVHHPRTAEPSTDFLGLSGTGGVWESVGGIDAAGVGVVVGVIDTGIAPENPSFSGDPLGSTAGAEPYLVDGKIHFTKSDGGEYVTEPVSNDDWTIDDYSTKLVGARYFSAGAEAYGYDFSSDHLSPRDADGHGSHTSSTAAGNNGVDATVEGIDFGAISGVAPAAKIAMYKACYAGPDELSSEDDICMVSDLVAAIDAAVADGVDVINYSIGGGAASTVLGDDDEAFLGAAKAGIFVSVSAGNDGPGASTADHASPWYTTVAASTIPTYEGTVEWGLDQKAAGASVTMYAHGTPVSGPAVYSGDVALAGAAAEATLCYLGTLDPAKVAGKIVVCDRGGNARVEKSQEVKSAGGIGMVLVNVPGGADSVDNDFHSVPTVHLNAVHRQPILEYLHDTAEPTLTLADDNLTGTSTPTPQIAGFSSRGPILAGGSDVLKPDVSAPGVAILAAQQSQDGEPTFGFKSGTSMSSPHVAGLGALYLGEHPQASPAEVKSALMTTGYDLKDAAGAAVTDPFAQGAGHVDPTKYFDAGLLYLNDGSDWDAYLRGQGYTEYGDPTAEPLDASDLNLASMAIGQLAAAQTVTRTVTATASGTYTADVTGMAGIDVNVSPKSFTIEAGQTQEFTVTFTPTAATAPEQWSTGFLTWTSGTNAVRSPLAVFPVTADAPAEAAGTGMAGKTTVKILPGVNGDLPLNLSGLTPMVQLFDRKVKAGGHSGNQDSGAANDGTTYFLVDVPAGVTLSRFDLDSTVDTSSADLDLYVYRVVSKQDWTLLSTNQSATGSADEQVTITTPTAGQYVVRVDVYAAPAEGLQWDLRYGNVVVDKKFALTATPNPLPVTQGQATSFELSWKSLKADTRYLGVVQYGDSSVRTVVTVDSGAKK